MAIDIEQIKQNYAEFEDFKIEYLAKNNTRSLEVDIIPILTNQIKKRGLNLDLIKGIEAQKEELPKRDQQNSFLKIRVCHVLNMVVKIQI